jgi:hypothetical protein
MRKFANNRHAWKLMIQAIQSVKLAITIPGTITALIPFAFSVTFPVLIVIRH